LSYKYVVYDIRAKIDETSKLNQKPKELKKSVEQLVSIWNQSYWYGGRFIYKVANAR